MTNLSILSLLVACLSLYLSLVNRRQVVILHNLLSDKGLRSDKKAQKQVKVEKGTTRAADLSTDKPATPIDLSADLSTISDRKALSVGGKFRQVEEGTFELEIKK